MPTQHAPRATRRTRPTREHSGGTPAASPVGSAAPPAASMYSPESGRTYRLDRLIGKGGFGEVYLATTSAGHTTPAQVCVKISDRIAGWLREAYFADLLAREARALRVYDRFVTLDGGQMLYCLAMEYAEHGDLGAWLGEHGAQSERFVRREIAAILGALDTLHRGQALHRDLTPFNVFVCTGERLKLGDFGIAAHQVRRLAALGHKVTVIGERQFWRLAVPVRSNKAPLSARNDAANRRVTPAMRKRRR